MGKRKIWLVIHPDIVEATNKKLMQDQYHYRIKLTIKIV